MIYVEYTVSLSCNDLQQHIGLLVLNNKAVKQRFAMQLTAIGADCFVGYCFVIVPCSMLGCCWRVVEHSG